MSAAETIASLRRQLDALQEKHDAQARDMEDMRQELAVWRDLYGPEPKPATGHQTAIRRLVEATD